MRPPKQPRSAGDTAIWVFTVIVGPAASAIVLGLLIGLLVAGCRV